MVLKTQTCRFSGLRIYPGRGILFVRVDGQQYLFINQKAKELYNQRKRPAKIAWTVAYRKAHKKDQSGAIIKKKKRSLNKALVRSYAAASLEVRKGAASTVITAGQARTFAHSRLCFGASPSLQVIHQKRNEKPDARKAAREQAIRQVKEKKKADAADKAAQKAQAAAQKASAKHSGKGR